MRSEKTKNDRPCEQSASHQEVWLLGQPPLQSYLKFVEETVPGGAGLCKATLADEWRAANDYYGGLEKTEAGIADKVEIAGIDRSLAIMAKAVTNHPYFRRTFDVVPTRIAMVELDKLIVSQRCVSLHHTDSQKTRLGPKPDLKSLFRFCLPVDRREAAVQMRKTGSRRYIFWSGSADFRFQECAVLRPDQITGFEPFGAIGGVVGLMVGYDSNFLNVIQSENRLVLHDGHHRAYALRDAGITHAPCIIQSVTRLDELKLVASDKVLDDPEFFFSAKRPPILRDFFDPKIRKVWPVYRTVSVVEVNFETREYTTRDFSNVE